MKRKKPADAPWVRPLLRWFERDREEFPWRREPRDPYVVWVAEVMLQQTQVAAAVPYLERWLRHFPTVARLARADADRVLKAWEGLGYYSRARNLLKAARTIVRDCGGVLPRTVEGLRALPGIGDYSARSIAALAYGTPVLGVDGNIRRVGARLYALPSLGDREARDRLEPLMPAGRAGPFTEALMELGRRVCKPRGPLCGACPVRRWCAALSAGDPQAYPAGAPKARPRRERKAALVRVRGGRVGLVKRGEGERLGGLWGFPLLGRVPRGGKRLDPIIHAYSGFTLTAVPVVVAEGGEAYEGERFVTPGEALDLPLSVLDRKVMEKVAKELGAGNAPRRK
jgi:A/G-specific adenine glycosylase